MRYQQETQPPSQLIRDAIRNTDHSLKVEDIIRALGSQSFGLIFVVMALPMLVPLPPGIAFIPAALLLIWSVQRALGGTYVWLPKELARKGFLRDSLIKLKLRRCHCVNAWKRDFQ